MAVSGVNIAVYLYMYAHNIIMMPACTCVVVHVATV